MASQPRSDDGGVRKMWAVWEPVAEGANPLVIAGDYGAITFHLCEQVAATETHAPCWFFQGSAATGRWKRDAVQKQALPDILARLIATVALDGASGRLTNTQVQDVFLLGSFLQLQTKAWFAVVNYQGTLRLARPKSTIPFIWNIAVDGANPAVPDIALTAEDVFIPAPLPDGSPSAGVKVLTDVTVTDRATLAAHADALHKARTGPGYAMNLRMPPGPPQQAAQPPIQQGQGSTYTNLTPEISIGTQWSVTLTVGNSCIFANTTVEMKRSGFVTPIAGPFAGREFEWPAPPVNLSGVSVRMIIHSGPTAPADRTQAGSAYDRITVVGELNKEDLLTWDIFLNPESDSPEGCAYQLRCYLDREYGIGVDQFSKLALCRDELLRWSRQVMEVHDWKQDPALLQLGQELLRNLRIVHMQAAGYDTSSLTKSKGAVTDDIAKERAKQDSARSTRRHVAPNLSAPRPVSSSRKTCFSCHAFGHLAKDCPSRLQPAIVPPPPNDRRYGSTTPRTTYAQRECQFCFERGLPFKGHFSDNCFVKNPALKSGFQPGGVPLRK